MDLGNFRGHKGDDEDTWASWLSDYEPADGDGQESPQHASPQSRPPQPGKSPADGFLSLGASSVPALQHKTTGARQGSPAGTSRIPAKKRSKSSRQPAGTKHTPTDKAISIEISLPEFHLPKLPRLSIPWRQLRPWLIGVTVLLAAVVGGNLLLNKTRPHVKTTKEPVVVQAELGYRPLVPGTRASGEAKASDVSFDAKRKLYSYKDAYKGVNITVDQQALPAKLKTKQALQELYNNLQADDSFSTSRGEVHIYTDETSGAQRLVLTNSKMLMFLQSTRKLSNEVWVEYIQALQ